MAIEQAVRTKTKELPQWVLNLLADELVAARAIAEPHERRLAEIAVDMKRDRLLMELRGGE